MVVSAHTELSPDAKLGGQRPTGRERSAAGFFGRRRVGWIWRRRGEELRRKAAGHDGRLGTH